jgi:hypothetical protein
MAVNDFGAYTRLTARLKTRSLAPPILFGLALHCRALLTNL